MATKNWDKLAHHKSQPNTEMWGNKAKFGSVKWQEQMEKTIGHKLEHGERLSPQERAYIPVQRAHNILRGGRCKP